MTKNLFFTICIVLLFLSACIAPSKLKYVQDGNSVEELKKQYPITQLQPYRIKPYDLLFINVLSYDEKSLNVFNASTGTGNSTISTELVSYSVNDSGYVTMPLIKKVNIKDMTLEEAQVCITQKLSEYINQPVVTIKLLEKTVTLLGEIKTPARISLSKEQLNIFQAIAMAGDITSFGNRKKVILIRDVNGVVSYNYLDLTKKNIVQSEFYYLKPNDIIYVEPVFAKTFNINSSQYSVLLGSITTLVSLILLLRNIK